MSLSVLVVINTFRGDGEHSFSLWQARRIIDLAHSALVPTFSQTETGRRCVGNNVTSNGLLGVGCEHGSTIDLRHDLVGDDDGDAELVSNALERAQKLRQVHLTSRQLASAAEVRAIESSRTIDDHQSEAVLGHQGCSLEE